MTILDKLEVQQLYDAHADGYDRSLALFRLLGVHRWRASLIDRLGLSMGDTVVDLCCGTGANFEPLAKTVGETGCVIGVDISPGMLAIAQAKAAKRGLANVQLIECDVESYSLPPRTAAVISTLGLEMVPQYELVVSSLASQLPPDGRLGLLGLKHPENWPRWLIDLSIWMTKRYGVTRDYEQFRPWEAAERHFQMTHFEQHLAGAAYICVATAPRPAGRRRRVSMQIY